MMHHWFSTDRYLHMHISDSDILLCDNSLPSDASAGGHYMPLELVALVQYSLSYIPVGSGAFSADLLLTYFRYSFVGMEKQLERLPNYHCSPYCSAYSVIECLCPISVPADDNEGICLQYTSYMVLCTSYDTLFVQCAEVISTVFTG